MFNPNVALLSAAPAGAAAFARVDGELTRHEQVGRGIRVSAEADDRHDPGAEELRLGFAAHVSGDHRRDAELFHFLRHLVVPGQAGCVDLALGAVADKLAVLDNY